MRRIEATCSTTLSDGTIRPVSGSALQVRHRKHGHGVPVGVVSDEREWKPAHEVPTIGFVDERPTFWTVENAVNRNLELLCEVPGSRS